MRVVIYPMEAWAVAGGDEQPCLQLREQVSQRSTVDICFDETNRHVIETIRNELTVIERALGPQEPRG